MFALTLFDFNVVQLFSSRGGGKYGGFILFFVVLNKCFQGSKKVPSGHSGEVDIPAGQVTFHSHLPDWTTDQQSRLARGEHNLTANCPKGRLEVKFFFFFYSEPWFRLPD